MVQGSRLMVKGAWMKRVVHLKLYYMVPIRLLFEVIVEGNTMNDVTFIKKRGEMERI